VSSALFSGAFITKPLEPSSDRTSAKQRRGARRTSRPNASRSVNETERHRAILDAVTSALRQLLSREPGLLTIEDRDALSEQVADILAGRSVILRLNQDLDSAGRGAVETFLQSVIQATENLDATRQETAIAKLAEVMLPDPLSEARGAIALDNLRLRDRFLAEEGTLTSAEVGEQSGSRGKSNPYATAARWKKAGRIFSINHRGVEIFPAFQFRDGQPHPTIAKVLATLPRRMTPWQIAFWFVTTNGWLDDDAPNERLDDVEQIVEAAKREGEEVMG
jgi:hypothetical protein